MEDSFQIILEYSFKIILDHPFLISLEFSFCIILEYSFQIILWIYFVYEKIAKKWWHLKKNLCPIYIFGWNIINIWHENNNLIQLKKIHGRNYPNSPYFKEINFSYCQNLKPSYGRLPLQHIDHKIKIKIPCHRLLDHNFKGWKQKGGGIW